MNRYSLTLLACALMCGVAFVGGAQDARKPLKAEKAAAKADKKATKGEERMLIQSIGSFMEAVFAVPAAKDAVEAYRAESGAREQELQRARARYQLEVRQAADAGADDAKVKEIMDRAKAEVGPMQEKLTDARIKMAEALVAAAKADPKAVAAQETEDFMLFLSRASMLKGGAKVPEAPATPKK
jgi:hypothetical protein